MRRYIEIVGDFDILLRGVGQLGRATKIMVPNLTQVKEGHTSGVGDYEVSIGQFEKMEAGFEIAAESVDLYVTASALNGAEVDFIEAVKEGNDTREGLYEFRGILDIEGGDGERKGKKMMTGKLSLNKAYHEINGTEVYHIDHLANIARVNGVDFAEATRKIIGV